MRRFTLFLKTNGQIIVAGLICSSALLFVLLYKLGSLTHGLSHNEVLAVHQIVGWHGILHDPLYLPLKIIRSVLFTVDPTHGQTISRLPNAIFGGLAIISFTTLVRLWHGNRTAVFSGLLFGLSAWTLHVSRLASFDVLYLWAIPTLLLTMAIFHRSYRRPVVAYSCVIILGLLLYIPGMIWFILIAVSAYRRSLPSLFARYHLWWQRALMGTTLGIWVLPLLYKICTNIVLLKEWVGLPAHMPSIDHIAKNIFAIPLHLFVRGPQYPELWLGKMPVFDVFCLVLSLAGAYFYARHRSNSRSKLLALLAAISILLVGFGGPVKLSLFVPIVYLCAATGVTYLLQEWLKVFPINPLARALGIALITTAVGLSCTLNTRAYFVAWPHNLQTKAVFQNHL